MDPLSGGAADARALLLLRSIPGVGDVGVARRLAASGSPQAALARERIASEGVAAVDEALRRCAALGVTVLPRTAPDYPQALLDLDDPPAVLFLRGRSELLDRPCAALVGSRRATAYGRRVAARLAAALARSGAVVLSGMALGVDGEAHRGALDADGDTVAVLGSGPDAPQPASHAHLYRAIVDRGLVVSEHPPGTPGLAHHFPRRNRIMAALARAVVVVEAAERSGALITARQALDLGREVLAVPGPIDAPASAGTNALIRDGAHPVLGPEEVLRALGLAMPAEVAAEPALALGADAAALWSVLGPAPVDVDALARRSGLPARRALSALSLLEMDGWAIQSAGARFARRP